MLSDSLKHSQEKLQHLQSMAWLVCLSAGLFFFYEFFQLNLFDVINEPLRQEFQLDAAQISWLSSSYLWADILFLLPAGIILDRFSVRRVILTAMLMCVVSTIGFALTHSFLIAFCLHFLSGIGGAFCFLACVLLITRWFPSRRQAFVVGCVVTMAFLGGMVAHTPLAYLNKYWGWRNSLLIDGGIGLLFFAWLYYILQDFPTRDMVAKKHDSQATKPCFSKAFFNSQNWLTGLYTSCLNLPILVLCALWGASYLEVVHQLPKIAASNVVSLIFMGSILGCPLVGWWSDAMGKRRPLMIWGAIATLIILIPLVWGVVLSKMVLSIIFFVLGVVTSTQVITYPMIAESNPQVYTGAATGLASIIIMGGGAVGQVLFGMLMHGHAGIENYTVSDFQFAMWMFPIATVVALIAVLLSKETYCKRF